MREAPRSLTHSDARMSLREHHDEHMRALFAGAGNDAGSGDGSGGSGGSADGLTESQVEYLLRVGRVFRSEQPEQNGAKYREYIRECFPKDARGDSGSGPGSASGSGAACRADPPLASQGTCACGGSRRYDAREQQLVCTSCGISVHDFTIAMPQHGTEESSVVGQFTYKKVNHFREWISQVQGREMSDLSVPVSAVLQELKKERVSEEDQVKLTPVKIRAYLRRLRLGSYDHVHLIHAQVTGRRPPQFDHDTEQKLVEMFKATLAPFELVRQRVCPERRNFLSYSFVLRKLTGIIGVEVSEEMFFPMLKSREKLFLQDCVWRGICAELGWPFERSS
jgi:hypothetical protein